MPGQSGYPYAREKRKEKMKGDVGTTEVVLGLAGKICYRRVVGFWFATRRGGALEAGGFGPW